MVALRSTTFVRKVSEMSPNPPRNFLFQDHCFEVFRDVSFEFWPRLKSNRICVRRCPKYSTSREPESPTEACHRPQLAPLVRPCVPSHYPIHTQVHTRTTIFQSRAHETRTNGPAKNLSSTRRGLIVHSSHPYEQSFHTQIYKLRIPQILTQTPYQV